MFGLAEGQHGPAFQGNAQPVKAKLSQPTKPTLLGPGKQQGSDTSGEAWQRKREGKLQAELSVDKQVLVHHCPSLFFKKKLQREREREREKDMSQGT